MKIIKKNPEVASSANPKKQESLQVKNQTGKSEHVKKRKRKYLQECANLDPRISQGGSTYSAAKNM